MFVSMASAVILLTNLTANIKKLKYLNWYYAFISMLKLRFYCSPLNQADRTLHWLIFHNSRSGLFYNPALNKSFAWVFGAVV